MIRRFASWLVIFMLVLPVSGAPAEDTGVALTVRRGTVIGDPGALAERDQDPGDDDPAAYVRLDPEGGRFLARIEVFGIPGGSVEVFWARRAALWRDGPFRVQVRSVATGTWSTLLTSKDVLPGRWMLRSARIDPAEHVTSRDSVVLRIVGSGIPLDVDAIGVRPSPPWWRPGPGTTWQWQLVGRIDDSYDVAMYDVDLFEVPRRVIGDLQAGGRAVVCYFSAGAWEDWRPDAGAFPEDVLGAENGWPGERWLDVRRLDVLGPIMESRLDRAVRKGCDGVEPDNVDGFTNETGFPLTAADQEAFNRWLAAEAHARGLSVGLKNDLEQVEALVDDFDWALDEQCFEYEECEMLLPFIDDGKAVFGVEYALAAPSFCPEARAMGLSWLRKHEALGPWVNPC